ncbi:Hypothetical predicted protein [Cloeon dipterum]|uniref:DUF1279 domain-containing protein n=1 Tax=Cloeon dipterum TaxID=197152 RepID=A0A8S1C1A7_9INSE|nr:Hypothetical predicted protein [Cloeon dipterum]
MLAQRLIRRAGRPLLRTFSARQGFRPLAPASQIFNFQTEKQNARTTNPIIVSRYFSKQTKKEAEQTAKDAAEVEVEKKLSLFQKFKQMYKEYWYVLLPVHVATSAVWVGCFYYIVRSGVDVPALLHTLHFPDKALDFIKNNSSTGHLAVVYAMYKVATPARYFVTVGGTTLAINKLKAMGYIKPMPNREQLKEMYQEQRDNLKERYQERRDSFKDNMQERKDNLMQKLQKKQ